MAAPPYKILFTGSRDLKNPYWVNLGLTRLASRVDPERKIIVTQGECYRGGGDYYAKQWALAHAPRVICESRPADWSQGPRGGPIRNQRMVDEGHDVCLAVIGPCTSRRCRRKDPHGSHGASDCADRAEKAGITTYRKQLWKGTNGNE